MSGTIWETVDEDGERVRIIEDGCMFRIRADGNSVWLHPEAMVSGAST